MSNRCQICGKGSMKGNLVSHSNIKTKRVTKPNLQRVKAVVEGVPQRVRICTRCIRAGEVEKRTR